MDAIPNLDLSQQPQVSEPTDLAMTYESKSMTHRHNTDLTLKIVRAELPGDGSFGLSIAGGGNSPPYIEGDGSVFISRVAPDGRAEMAGIKVGDKLVEINGQSVLNTAHEVVANQLRHRVVTTRVKT